MPFVERNAEKEDKILEELLKTPEGKIAHEEFEAEYNFRKALYNARKNREMSQKQLSEITGLSQQMISRIETGWCDTKVGTLLKYLNGIGYSLKVVKNEN